MASKRKRIKMLVEISVPLAAGLTKAQWRSEVRDLIRTDYPADTIKLISVKPYADPKVYPKERSAAARNREWLTKTMEALE